MKSGVVLVVIVLKGGNVLPEVVLSGAVLVVVDNVVRVVVELEEAVEVEVDVVNGVV